MRPGRYQDGGKSLGRPGYEGTTRSVRISIKMGAKAWGGLGMRLGRTMLRSTNASAS